MEGHHSDLAAKERSKKRDHLPREEMPVVDFHEEAQEWKGVLTAPHQAAVAVVQERNIERLD
jgi:hypothetical protein